MRYATVLHYTCFLAIFIVLTYIHFVKKRWKSIKKWCYSIGGRGDVWLWGGGDGGLGDYAMIECFLMQKLWKMFNARLNEIIWSYWKLDWLDHSSMEADPCYLFYDYSSLNCSAQPKGERWTLKLVYTSVAQ